MKRPTDRPVTRPSDREAIDATAAAWLAQRDAGLVAASEAEFARWRALDPRHEAAVARLENTWSALQQLRDFRPEAQRHPDRDLLRGRASRRRIISLPAVVTLAVAAAIAVAALGWFVGTPRAAELRYATTANGYERRALEDSSLLELNADSEVRVHFTAAERRVRLVRGEAHFTVAKNPARPFLVEADSVAVRAIGTAFNVRLAAGNVEVLVTEGKVRVGSATDHEVGTAPFSPAPTAGSDVGQPASGVVVAANQRTLISTMPIASGASTRAPVVEDVAPDSIREALAWQGPRLVFVDTPLVDVIAQFNRRNAVQLVLADPELAGLPIGGSFRVQNVEAFVRLLASGSDIVADRPDPAHIVLRKAK